MMNCRKIIIGNKMVNRLQGGFSLKRLRYILFIFTLGVLFLMPSYAFASHTEYTAGNQGVYSIYDRDTSFTTTPYLVTAGKDSIVSITVRYRRVYGNNVSVRLYGAMDSSTNFLSNQIESGQIIDTTWSSPVTYNFSDNGYNSLRLYGFTTTTTDGVIAQMEVLSMVVRRYDIDSTNISLESDGFIHASFVNSTPNSSIRYTMKNNQTGAIKNNSDTWVDTSVGVGKSYSYTLQWGFYPPNISQSVDMGSIYIPMDTDLTNRVNTIISNTSNVTGNTVEAVRDSSGTVLSEARQAKNNSLNASTYALQAATYASQASTNSQNAYNTTQTVNTKVDALTNAVNDINTSIVGVNDDNSLIVSAVRDPDGTVLSVSKGTQGAVEDANGNTVSAVRDNAGTVLDASRTANEKIDALQTTVNNYMTSDTSPPSVRLGTVSGARATSGNSIRIIVSVSDNVSSTFLYSLDYTNYEALPGDRVITVPLNGTGSIPVNIWVMDEAGNKGMDSIVIKKL